MANVPGEPPYPLGVYKERPPADATFIDSHDVGGSIPAQAARKLTSGANALNKLYHDLVPGL